MAQQKGYANKTTPVAADRLTGLDSASSDVTKNFRMDNLRTFMQARTPAPDPIVSDDGILQLDAIDENYGEYGDGGTIFGTNLTVGKRFGLTVTAATKFVSNDAFTVPGGVITAEDGDYITLVDVGGGVSAIELSTPAAGTTASEGAKASGWVDFTDWPANGEDKNFDGFAVTFKTSPGAWPEVGRGAGLDEALDNLVIGLNASSDVRIPLVDWSTDRSHRVYGVAKSVGTALNDFDLTGGSCDFTTSASTLTGGVDPTSGTGGAICKLSTTTVATDVGTKQDLYTVPTGKRCIVTKVVVKDATTSLAAMGDTLHFGFDGGAGDWNRSIGSGSLARLVDGTVSITAVPEELIATGAQTIGTAADVFGCIFNDTSITGGFVTIDVFGYLYDA